MDHFLPFFYCLTTQKKMKKMPENIIISHKCAINDNHMMYDSWDMTCDKQNFLSFWVIFFLPFTSLTPWKKKEKRKKEKNTWRYHHFTILHQKSWSYMLYCSWDMARDECNYFSFWAIFYPFTLLKAQKSKFHKNKINAWRYYHFTQVYQKSWSYAILFLRYGAWQM